MDSSVLASLKNPIARNTILRLKWAPRQLTTFRGEQNALLSSKSLHSLHQWVGALVVKFIIDLISRKKNILKLKLIGQNCPKFNKLGCKLLLLIKWIWSKVFLLKKRKNQEKKFNLPIDKFHRWKRISCSLSARWQHLSQLKGSAFFSSQKISC